ncbi:MAG: NAD(P)-binding domain-containing protein [Calditrichaeota bacterium]|nr:NAD(P)-binding domain-containing protein [Calditrichota bacterium]
MIETLIYIFAGLLTVGIPTIYFIYESKKSKQATNTLQKSIESGLDEPPSLHPIIDPNICIGTAACVSACPEQTIIGLINNRGQLVKPSACIGHGECQASCPVDAITLVFGTEKRGVDIPQLKTTFETNVPGIFIAGELGGMGLIRNAVTQGRQAVEFISKNLNSQKNNNALDLLIVGAGPAGIGAALQAKKEGVSFEIIDQEDLGGTILTYPRQKLVMTQPMELPLYGHVKFTEISKESLLELFQKAFADEGLKVIPNEKVTEISRSNGFFNVKTGHSEYTAQKLLLAIGRRGSPRKLNVPGEKCNKVTYRLLDPEKYKDLNILVVGGGDSAIEAALALSEQDGNIVTLSYRKESFFRVKVKNTQRIEQAIAENTLKVLFKSQVKQIEKSKVLLTQNGDEVTLKNDYVFVMVGGELPTVLLEKAGIEFTRKFGEA